jgi:glycerophosphoryl diester phosphodiesterase
MNRPENPGKGFPAIFLAIYWGGPMSCSGQRIEKETARAFTGRYPVLVVAHRGFSGAAPENTLVAFQKAIELGSDMIELDVHLSKEGEVVVIHDSTLERTTPGQGKIIDHTLQELRQLDAGVKFSPLFAGERIPTLKEVLDLAQGKIEVNIEVKNGFLEPYSIHDLADRTLKAVENAGMLPHVLFSSFHPVALERIREKNPKAYVALLFSQPWNALEEVTKGKSYSVLNLRDIHLIKEKIALLKKHNLRVNVYTVNSEEGMNQFISWGVDGIITNYPNRLINLLRRR